MLRQIVVWVCLTSGPADAVADQWGLGSPFRGLHVPAAAVAGDADATAVEVNPGQLGGLAGFQAALVVDGWWNRVALPGRGVGVMATGSPVPALTLGAGFQWIAPSLEPNTDSYRKLQAALGVRLGSRLGAGLGYEYLQGGPRLFGKHSLGAGLALRLDPRFALGLVGHELNLPTAYQEGVPVSRNWELEVAIGSGADRLRAALSLHLEEGLHLPPHPRGRLRFLVRPGLGVLAEVDSARDQRPQLAYTGLPSPSFVYWTFLIGIELYGDTTGMTAGGLVALQKKGYEDRRGAGLSAIARFSTQPTAPPP